MKSIIILLFIVLSSLICFCQSKITKYCTIACYGNSKPSTDYVSAESVLISYETSLEENLKGVREFKSPSGILNYMDHKGWVLVSESIGYQFNGVIRFFFKKEFYTN